jgi:N-acetylglucosaminyl-diphospho-decaprenol L-rhamnosyltransferase
VPDAHVRHIGNASSKPSWRTQLFKDFHYQRSKRLIIRKYLGVKASELHRLKLIFAGVFAVLIYSLLLRKKYAIRWAGWFASALA